MNKKSITRSVAFLSEVTPFGGLSTVKWRMEEVAGDLVQAEIEELMLLFEK